MYNLTADELALWQHPYPQRCTISSTKFTLTEADIINFYVDRRSVNGTSLELGSVIASELSFVLDNHDGRWNKTSFEGATINVQVSTTDGTTTSTVPLGQFNIDGAPRKVARLRVTALDRMVKFDKTYKDTISFPTTPADIVAACCTFCEVPYDIPDWTIFANYNTLIKSANVDGRTYRELLSMAFEIMGVCGYINANGYLTCDWYKEPVGNTLTIQELNRTSSDVGDMPIVVDGIKVGNKVYSNSEDPVYILGIQGNAFVSDDNADAIGTGLLAKLDGFTYYSATASVLPCPHVWPMDRLTFYKDEVEYPIIVTNVNYKLNGLTMLTSAGETETSKGYAQANPFTKNTSSVITDVEGMVASAKTVVKTYTNGSAYSLTGNEQAIIRLSWSAFEDTIAVFVATINVDMESDGNLVLVYRKSLVEVGTLTQYVPKGSHIVTVSTYIPSAKDEQVSWYVGARTEYYESTDRVHDAKIISLWNYASSGTLNDPIIDTTTPKGTIPQGGIRAVAFSQGLNSTIAWDGTLEFTEEITDIVLGGITVESLTDSLTIAKKAPDRAGFSEVLSDIVLGGIVIEGLTDSIEFDRTIPAWTFRFTGTDNTEVVDGVIKMKNSFVYNGEADTIDEGQLIGVQIMTSDKQEITELGVVVE